MSAAAGASGGAPARALAGRLLRGSFLYGSSDLAQRAIALALIPVYARHLATEDYGIVGVLTAAGALVAAVVGLGLRAAVVREYYDYRGDPRELRSYVGTVLWLVIGAGALVAAGAGWAGESLSRRVFERIPFAPFVPLTLWAALFAATVTVLQSLYRAREQAGRYAALQLAGVGLSSLAILYFVVARGEGALGFAKGTFLGGALVFAASLWLARREASPRFAPAKARGALALGLPVVPHLLAAWVLTAVDRLLLERMTPLSEVGVYTLGYQIGSVVGLLAAAVNSAWTPIFFERAAEPGAARVFARVFTPYAAALTLVAGGFVLFAREIVLLAAGEAYRGAAAIVPVVTAAYLCQGLYFMLGTPLFYAKRTERVALVSMAAAALKLALVPVCVAWLGIAGAAYATLAAFALLGAGAYAFARRELPIPYEARKLAALAALFLSAVLLAPLVTVADVGVSAALKALVLGGQVATLLAVRAVSLESLAECARALLARGPRAAERGA